MFRAAPTEASFNECRQTSKTLYEARGLTAAAVEVGFGRKRHRPLARRAADLISAYASTARTCQQGADTSGTMKFAQMHTASRP
jgi:hypothetical protein